jgi:hypothetical protein
MAQLRVEDIKHHSTLLHSSNDYDIIGVGGFAIVLPSSKCPMQLLTSSDDVLVKFWDAIFAS